MKEIKTISQNSYILGEGITSAQIRTEADEVVDLSVKNSTLSATLKGQALTLSSTLKSSTSIADVLAGKEAGFFVVKNGVLDLISGSRFGKIGTTGKFGCLAYDPAPDVVRIGRKPLPLVCAKFDPIAPICAAYFRRIVGDKDFIVKDPICKLHDPIKPMEAIKKSTIIKK